MLIFCVTTTTILRSNTQATPTHPNYIQFNINFQSPTALHSTIPFYVSRLYVKSKTTMFLIKRKTNAATSRRSSRASADLARMASTPVPQQASASPMPEGVTDPNYQPLPGMLGNLTVIQHDGLEKLRKELQEEGAFVPERMDDAMLLRWVLFYSCGRVIHLLS